MTLVSETMQSSSHIHLKIRPPRGLAFILNTSTTNHSYYSTDVAEVKLTYHYSGSLSKILTQSQHPLLEQRLRTSGSDPPNGKHRSHDHCDDPGRDTAWRCC
jgi:hypothetical protein